MSDDKLRISTLHFDVEADVEISIQRLEAFKLYVDDVDEITPSRYLLTLEHRLRLNMADEATVRRIRDALTELLELPAPTTAIPLIKKPRPADE